MNFDQETIEILKKNVRLDPPENGRSLDVRKMPLRLEVILSRGFKLCLVPLYQGKTLERSQALCEVLIKGEGNLWVKVCDPIPQQFGEGGSVFVERVMVRALHLLTPLLEGLSHCLQCVEMGPPMPEDSIDSDDLF